MSVSFTFFKCVFMLTSTPAGSTRGFARDGGGETFASDKKKTGGARVRAANVFARDLAPARRERNVSRTFALRTRFRDWPASREKRAGCDAASASRATVPTSDGAAADRSVYQAHAPMTVPCTTVPFLSSMVHVSWLSFCKKRTSFIVLHRPPRVSRSCARAGLRPDLPARAASPIETPTEASYDDRR